MTTENQVSAGEETQINTPEVTETTEVVKPEVESQEPQEKTETEPVLSDAEKDARAKQRRIDRLTRNNYETRAEVEQLRKTLEQMQQTGEQPSQDGQLTPQQIDDMVEKRTAERLNSQTFNQRTYTVDKELQKTVGAGLPEFYDDLKQAGYAGTTLVQAAIELDDSAVVLAYLAKNPDEFDKVIELSPLKQAAALGKLSAKLESDKAKPTRSSAPTPITPVKGTATSDEPDINDTARWIAWSNKQDARKRNR